MKTTNNSRRKAAQILFKTEKTTMKQYTLQPVAIAVVGVESAVKYSFVCEGIQTRRKGQNKADLTLSPRLHVKPLITAIKAIWPPSLKPSLVPRPPDRQ